MQDRALGLIRVLQPKYALLAAPTAPAALQRLKRGLSRVQRVQGHMLPGLCHTDATLLPLAIGRNTHLLPLGVNTCIGSSFLRSPLNVPSHFYGTTTFTLRFQREHENCIP
jgi:hypothetical protein